jgi:hypothetical protein
MKPHPRIRKTIKWTGAAVTVLLVVVWIGSGWWTWHCKRTRGRWVQVDQGRLSFGESITRPATPTPFFASTGVERVELTRMVGNDRQATVRLDLRKLLRQPPLHGLLQGFGWHESRNGWSVHVPLWAPAIVSIAASALAWRLDTLARRRAKLNLCAKCNYDRTGLANNVVCPECGAAAPRVG